MQLGDVAAAARWNLRAGVWRLGVALLSSRLGEFPAHLTFHSHTAKLKIDRKGAERQLTCLGKVGVNRRHPFFLLFCFDNFEASQPSECPFKDFCEGNVSLIRITGPFLYASCLLAHKLFFFRASPPPCLYPLRNQLLPLTSSPPSPPFSSSSSYLPK